MTTTCAIIQTYEFDRTTGEACEGTGAWASDLRLGFDDGTSDLFTSIEFDHEPTAEEATAELRALALVERGHALDKSTRAAIEAL